MHGLAVLLHDIVGDIHQVVDGPDAAGGKPSAHPLRGRANLNVFADPGTVPGAERRILHFHAHIVVHILLVSHSFYLRGRKGLPESCRRLPGQAQHTVAVHPVAGDLILEHRVVKPQQLHRVRPHGNILPENVDSLLGSLRVHVSVRAQLFNGAHHAVGGNPPELSGLNLNAILGQGASVMTSRHLSPVQNHGHLAAHSHILRACDNLNGLPANVHLAHNELIRVRMPLDGEDLAHQDLLQVPVPALIAFHLGT